MSAIEVEAPGLFTTVQDLGREGFGPLGVSASGAADPTALRLGNRLIGNPEGAPALEMTLLGGTFRFRETCILALAGSDFGATLGTSGSDSASVPLWTSVQANAGQSLRLGSTQSGARCYLCVRGGIVVREFLGSASTHVLSGLGGFEGRALLKGDVLIVGDGGDGTFQERRVSPQLLHRLAPRKSLRVTAGPQMDWFDEATRHTFFATSYRVSEESNRMGIRLASAPGQGAGPAGCGRQLITEGISLGAIQLPDSGSPIILFVEQQTTGGYPKIANVISADLPSLGQLRPRDEIRFELVEWERARALLAEREGLLRSAELFEEDD